MSFSQTPTLLQKPIPVQLFWRRYCDKYSTKLEEARANELRNALQLELRFLAERIDRGVRIEVSTPESEAEEQPEGEEKQSEKILITKGITIQELARRGSIMRAFERSREPLLMLDQERKGNEAEVDTESDNEGIE